MNIEYISALTDWEFRPSGTDSVLAIAPLTLGADGQHASFYIAQPSANKFVITDLGETAMHASQFGVELSPSRINTLNATNGIRYAYLRKDGAICAEGPMSELRNALWDALKLAMSFSFNMPKWSPKLDQIRFRSLVEQDLRKSFGNERVLLGVKATGVSGHTVEFPFALKASDASDSMLYYVEPIGLSNGKVDWQHVYQAHGKLSDVKQADDENMRLVIFEDGAQDVEYGRATTLLSQAATIQTLTQFRDSSASLLGTQGIIDRTIASSPLNLGSLGMPSSPALRLK